MLTNVCATFGESEVICRVVEGVSYNRVCAGIMRSVALRTVQLVEKLQRVRGLPTYLAGGLAGSQALAVFLAEHLETDWVLSLPEPRYNGALGCIALARAKI